ncbi:ABC transporter transmembrane domain-containing protein [Primorskyibacter sp. S87]|uniref:ABC transporter transmembrane domain-containing protein n=1 Tax=Primorskyibacter sp. S87 TaxID=3415126 RepID=UPI003C79C887
MLALYAAIWRISGRRQIILILLSIGIAALAPVSLNFQKEIVNLLTDQSMSTDELLLYCAGMFGAILLSLVLKWISGYRSGLLGEDVIRHIRRLLFHGSVEQEAEGDRVRRGTLTTAISAEAEELGKFAGAAFSEPVVQIGTLISVIGFIAATQPFLGLIAASMILPQILIVLISQRQVNKYVAERVRILRAATDALTAEQIATVGQDVEHRFDEIYDTRRKMFIWKLSSKFILSAINGAGTVGLLLLGGWLVIDGKTDVGTVVAATIGLGRIQGPTAFLIAFYRQVSANRIKFELLLEIFGPGFRGAAARDRTAPGQNV